jgi:indolepyruvate ferredoxin oxidoreductase
MNAPLPESIRKAIEAVSLDDKYELTHGRAFMSGVDARVRLPLLARPRARPPGRKPPRVITGDPGPQR